MGPAFVSPIPLQQCSLSHESVQHPANLITYRSKQAKRPRPAYFHMPPPVNFHHQPPAAALRIGHGYDLHRLEPGHPFILGGVKLDHDRGPVGHSDGDAVYHCVVDAILGALALPDIGEMFPDTDPRYKNQPSSLFLQRAREEMENMGWRMTNMDITIILERPKVAPIKGRIRENVARELGVEVEQVNVKAKTHEKVDAIGEGRAVEVHAVALLSEQLNEDEPVLHSKKAVNESSTQTLENPILNLASSRVKKIYEVTENALNANINSSEPVNRSHVMDKLHQTVLDRKRNSDSSSSWTAKLFSKGVPKIAQKVGEEATEVVIDAARGNGEGVVSESADLLYHLTVLWAAMDIDSQRIWRELSSREGVSGIEEKSLRPSS